MNIKALLLPVMLLAAASCRKKDENQYSYWYVNNDTFSTNDVSVDRGQVRTDFFTNSNYASGRHRMGFYFKFNQEGFPVDGVFILNCSSQNPRQICLGILYDDTTYLPSTYSTQTVTAALSNGKARYILDSRWFLNSYQSNDSILVRGVFNEP